MKKRVNNFLVKLILGLFLVLSPIVANADMGAPSTAEYEVTVSNVEGASLYDYNGNVIATIPYDTKLTILFEYTDNKGVLYGSVEYDDKSGEIKLSETKAVADSIKLEDFEKFDTPKKLYVFREGCYLYSGPSVSYDKLSEEEIPVGTTLEYQYYNEVWAYVEYDGKEGWVYIYPYYEVYDGVEAAVADVATKDSKVLTINKITTLYKEPSTGSETISVSIPAGEEVEYKYSFSSDPHGIMVYVVYNGVEGWLNIVSSSFYGTSESDFTAAVKQDCSSIFVLSETSLYSERENKDSKVKKTIPANTEVSFDYVIYLDESWYRVSYDGDDYWLYIDDDNSDNYELFYGYVSNYKTKKEVTIYESSSSSSNSLGKIKSDVSISSKYSRYIDGATWLYVVYDGVTGWVSTDSMEYIDSSEVCDVTYEEETKEDEKDEDTTGSEDKGSSFGLNLFIAIGGAVVLALVVIVTIVLIMKKKKKASKKDEVSAKEVKTETEETKKDEVTKQDK